MKTSYCYEYKIADIVLRFLLPEEIEAHPFFEPFRCENEQPDVRVTFCKVAGEQETLRSFCPCEITQLQNVGIGETEDAIYRVGYDRLFWTAGTMQAAVKIPKGDFLSCQGIYSNKQKVFFTQYDLLNAIGMEYLFNRMGAFLLHSAHIRYQGKGIIFSAPSGTGKSTQADLWQKYAGAEIINGDRSILKQRDGMWHSFGTPMAGSSTYCKNITSPLGAVVILRQGKENRLRKLSPGMAFRWIYSQTTVNVWDKSFQQNLMDQLGDLIGKVPVYEFYCLPEESAVTCLQEALIKEWN